MCGRVLNDFQLEHEIPIEYASIEDSMELALAYIGIPMFISFVNEKESTTPTVKLFYKNKQNKLMP